MQANPFLTLFIFFFSRTHLDRDYEADGRLARSNLHFSIHQNTFGDFIYKFR